MWHSYDFPTHVFFASHYQQSWWSLWEPRWFDGFDVSSYPPLVHQLIAIIGWLIGIPAAIGALTAVSLVSLPVAVYLLTRQYFGSTVAGRAAALSVVIPSVLLAAYTFGQLPTIFALDCALLCATAFGSFLERGERSRLALVLVLAAVTVAAHHATFIFFGPPLFGTVILAELLRSEDRRGVIVRSLVAVTSIAPIAFLVILPFWVWHATEYVAQLPIDHPSRHNLLEDVPAQKLFFWGEHGVLVVALLLGLPLLARQPRRTAAWILLASFLFVVGLGGTTPLPRLLFGSQWSWLTYDRFSLWSDIALAIVLAAFVSWRLDSTPRAGFPARAAWMLTLAVLGIFSAADALRPTLINATPAPIDPNPIVSFLGSNGNDRWRYLTFGFGEQAGVLNAMTDAGTVDGYYFTARRLPVLTESGIGQVDFSLAMDSQARTIRVLLGNPVPYNLRWAFTQDPKYEVILRDEHWLSRTTLANGVGVWESPVEVPPVPANSASVDPSIMLLGRWWGIVPLGALVSLAPASWLAWRARRAG